MAERGEHGRAGSLLPEILRNVTRVVARRPRIALWLVLVTCGACIGFTALHLNFRTSRSDLIDPEAPYHRRWLEYTEAFGDSSDIVVVVEGEEPEPIKRAMDDLGSRLQRESELFEQVLYRIEPAAMRSKGLQYLHPDELQFGLNRLSEYGPILRGEWNLVRSDALVARLYQQLRRREMSDSRRQQPLLEHSLQLANSLQSSLIDPDEFTSPWPRIVPVETRLMDQADDLLYLMNDAGTMGFLKCYAATESGDFHGSTAAIQRLRGLIQEVDADHPDVQIGATGIPILEYDEMQRSQTDMLFASVVSFAAVGLLLLIGFRGIRHPILALVMLAVGMAWSFGYTTATVGHLNILSVSFAAILIGLGIDFAIHYLARYLELRHQGLLLRPALMQTSGTVGTGIVTASITTALAFFCATFTEFLGVAELGLIAAGGILLCALATFVALPAMIAIADRRIEPRKLPTPFQANVLRAVTQRFPVPVMLLSLTLIALAGVHAFQFTPDGAKFGIRYDYNLLNLQANGLESVELQKRIFAEANDSLLFAVSVVDSPEQARELKSRYEQLPSVDHVEEMASRLPLAAEEETRLLVQAYHAQLAHLPPRPPSIRTADPAQFGYNLERLLSVLKRIPVSTARQAAVVLDGFLDDFDRLTLREQLAFVRGYQHRTTAALLGQFEALQAAADPTPVQLEDLPDELTSRYVSSEGQWLVQVFPREQIWDIEPLERFVKDVRSVDPDATGTPLQNYEASREIMSSYESAAVYALAAIFIVLLVDFLRHEHRLLALLPPAIITAIIGVSLRARGGELNWMLLIGLYLAMAMAIAGVLDFRNLRDALLSMLPPIAGAILMFGLFGLLGVDLNPANLIVLPLVLGIGVDDGVHVVHDFRQQQGRAYRTSCSTINAIILTSLTTMIGFGSLMLASHQGLYSVGLVMLIGVGSCWFVSLVALPPVLTLISRSDRSSAETANEESEQPPTRTLRRAA